MTFQDLLNQIQSLNQEQLSREVLVYSSDEDFFFDDGTSFAISHKEVPGLIDKDFPYFVV
jgi:hypothetical protein